MAHELLLTTEIRNAFAINILTDIKLSKAQISKIIHSDRYFGSWLGNLGKKALTNVVIPLARNNMLGLVSNLSSSAINEFDGVTETVKDEIKTQEWAFLVALLAPLAAPLVQPVISSVVKGISGRGIRRAGRGYMNKKF